MPLYTLSAVSSSFKRFQAVSSSFMRVKNIDFESFLKIKDDIS
jgi:hypothetical protein